VSADLSSLVGGKHAEGMEAGPSDRNQLSLEEKSKYLGGDMDHTHLVKGLDYALLQKVALQHPPPPPPRSLCITVQIPILWYCPLQRPQ